MAKSKPAAVDWRELSAVMTVLAKALTAAAKSIQSAAKASR